MSTTVINDTIADFNSLTIEADIINHSDNSFVAKLPEIETLADIAIKYEEITKWCDENPITDHVYEFRNERMREKFSGIDMLSTPDTYVAGSYALRQLLNYLDSHFPALKEASDNSKIRIVGNKIYLPTSSEGATKFKTQRPFEFKWISNDIDIFLINKERPAKNKIGKGLDIISSYEKSISELLNGFDLPICRVAINFEGTFFISIQAMSAILTRRMNIPIYLKQKEITYQILEIYCQENRTSQIPKFLVDRFYERIQKYSGRGFGVNWVDTNILIPWITKQSIYATLSKE